MDSWTPKLKLIAVLAATRVFLQQSKKEGWPDENPNKIADEVSQIIAHLSDPATPLPEYWKILFAPTGAIQEIAMSNGWHESYMKLASEWDDLAYLLK